MHVITQAALGMAVALAGLTGTSLSAEAVSSAIAHQEGALSAASCRRPIRGGGYRGSYESGTEPSGFDWDRDGRTDEVVVIAPDRTIRYAGKAAGGWKEMPGNGRADNMLGPNGAGDPRRCIVVYVDQGCHSWQDCLSGGPWPDWTTTG
ncbi:hypothetical protein AB0M57_15195 [Streptomyces sp. NPDC051597]|uniref:hypothetical protein n=1 Tax=Streptomyces sp. NPDC051597 TaxID=3155049 RepID=UPI0034153A59